MECSWKYKYETSLFHSIKLILSPQVSYLRKEPPSMNSVFFGKFTRHKNSELDAMLTNRWGRLSAPAWVSRVFRSAHAISLLQDTDEECQGCEVCTCYSWPAGAQHQKGGRDTTQTLTGKKAYPHKKTRRKWSVPITLLIFRQADIQPNRSNISLNLLKAIVFPDEFQ